MIVTPSHPKTSRVDLMRLRLLHPSTTLKALRCFNGEKYYVSVGLYLSNYRYYSGRCWLYRHLCLGCRFCKNPIFCIHRVNGCFIYSYVIPKKILKIILVNFCAISLNISLYTIYLNLLRCKCSFFVHFKLAFYTAFP